MTCMAGVKAKRYAIRALCGLLAVLAVFYFAYQIYMLNTSIKTQTAVLNTSYDTITTDVIAIRDETYISNRSAGSLVSVTGDGSRVANGAPVAYVFADETAAANYLKTVELQAAIARCNRFAKRSADASDITQLDKEIQSELFGLIAGLDAGAYEAAAEAAALFADALTRRQIETGKAADFSQKAAELTNTLHTLQKSLRIQSTVTAPCAGYYVSSVDGYEAAVPYSELSAITVSGVEQALQAQPAEVPSDVMGKIIKNFNWYFVCVVQTKDVGTLEIGQQVTVRMPYAAAGEVTATVYAMNHGGDGRLALLLQSDLMNASIAMLRKESAQLLLRAHTGYKIPARAVRVNAEGEKGVFVLKGNLILFKKIDVLYSGQDFVLTDPDSEKNEVRLYDQIILEGKNLEDGKVVD